MLSIHSVSIDQLKPYPTNARTHSKKQIAQIARSIDAFGFNNPILIDATSTVIAGHGRLMAAKELGLREVPTILIEHLSELQKRSYILADNKLAEKAGWDQDILKIELQNLLTFDINFDLTQTGFETPELDIILNSTPVIEEDPLDIITAKSEVLQRVTHGDLWKLGKHYLLCGDSLNENCYRTLFKDEEKADLVFTDPPYNVPVNGHVGGNGRIQHKEFAYASGEMSKVEFTNFLSTAFNHLTNFTKDGSIHFICMDWRHVREIMEAGCQAYTAFKNICVWNKQTGGMGSLYRSQHELIFVFKNGEAPHINNIELGKHGRYRTNIWDYPGVTSSGARRKELQLHPTVKPVQMIADAIIDCSARGSLVLDNFGGSGSTLLAAEKTDRRAYLIELEPKYGDVILHRFEHMTGKKAVLESSGHNV